ncbi:MAG: peptide chain release factor N(5)-glutamine methyltransferase [Gemmatimonadota bacterium]
MAETALELARKAGEVLAERGFENPRLEGELLLAGILGMRRLDLYLQHDRPVAGAELERFREAVRRRLRHEPLQYVLGEAPFRELMLRVDGRVLVPRPETEVLVEEVLRWARASSLAELDALDVGTGSGAIALSLAREHPFRRVVATDASGAAVDVARANAERLGLGERVEFRAGSLWEPIPPAERFHVVVSNPPYISQEERPLLPPEVLDWEPPDALFAPAGGLAVLCALVEGAGARLQPGGLLALEVGWTQAEEVADHVRRRGGYGEPRIIRDLADRPRVVLAESLDH